MITLTTGGSNVTINAGDGADTITNWQSDYGTPDNTSINGDTGNDDINNVGSTVRINGGDNDDKIFNSGHDVTIDGGKGNDFIENNKGNLAENGGVGMTILGGEDKDTIKNNGSCVTIDGGTDADSITNERAQGLYAGNYTYSGDEVSINGGNGNNTIVNGKFISGTERIIALDPTLFRIYESVKGGDKVTIETGTGNDTIHNFNSSEVSINAGGGVNLVSVSGNSSNITIKGGTGTDSIVFYMPKNFTNVDTNADEIPNDSRFGGSNILIEMSGAKNFISISSSWSYVTIKGDEKSTGADAILNAGDNLLLNAGNGLNLIENSGG